MTKKLPPTSGGRVVRPGEDQARLLAGIAASMTRSISIRLNISYDIPRAPFHCDGNMTRRFPLPWTVHQGPNSFWVQSANGMRFGFTYYDDRLAKEAAHGAHMLTEDEARRIVTNIAKLPELLQRRS